MSAEGIVIFGYSIIGAIIVGLILGVLAKFVMPGKQAVPLWLTILVGIVAAIIGNYVATLLGVRNLRVRLDPPRTPIALRDHRDRRTRRGIRQEGLIERPGGTQRLARPAATAAGSAAR